MAINNVSLMLNKLSIYIKIELYMDFICKVSIADNNIFDILSYFYLFVLLR